MILYQNY